MLELLKGFKTFITAISAVLIGGATAGGFLTPELGAEVSTSIATVVSDLERTAGGIMALIGVLMGALRTVTNSPIFKKY